MSPSPDTALRRLRSLPCPPPLKHSPPECRSKSGKIQRELKKLWDAGDSVMTRASLINLAVYSEAPDSLGKNTAIISQIDGRPRLPRHRHRGESAGKGKPSRGLDQRALPRQPRRQQTGLLRAAFVFARRQQCGLLPNIVFAQLDSDLPLYLWWQEEFRAPLDPQLWAWVDRVIYDSQIWRDFGEQMRLVETAQDEARQRIVLCDLNWVRLVHLRLALAQFFDHPATHHHLDEIKALEIEHAPGFRSTALLLVGWLAGQLDWTRTGGKSKSLGFSRDDRGRRTQNSRRAAREARANRSAAVGLLRTPPSSGFSTGRGADLLDVFFGRTEGRRMRQMLPAGKNDVVELVEEELMRGGPHRVYVRAVAKVRDLL